MSPIAIELGIRYRLQIRYRSDRLTCVLQRDGDPSVVVSEVANATVPPPGDMSMQSHSCGLTVYYVVRYQGT